ncbi:hypothetical protein N1937_28605 (plasmid) [Rhizobium sp. WSM4643]|uniref:hypothetical protein n=1 Tax=Rhizobium sp. WSM4643 TaxID=3138253 RepID=UPI0021A93FF1|nr:hypothetical protein [Rhizobium leguminosarum]UWM78757.1 hypothetical protein N1937_28605 [Rhizobium leguminosarum bv. viciae]
MLLCHPPNPNLQAMRLLSQFSREIAINRFSMSDPDRPVLRSIKDASFLKSILGQGQP